MRCGIRCETAPLGVKVKNDFLLGCRLIRQRGGRHIGSPICLPTGFEVPLAGIGINIDFLERKSNC
jgi:hypothetical protein